MTKIHFNNCRARIVDCPDNLWEMLRNSYKVPAPGAKYIKSHKEYIMSKGKRGWDGMVYVLDKNGNFDTGLLPIITLNLVNVGIIPEIKDERKKQSYLYGSKSLPHLRDYQNEIVKSCIDRWFSVSHNYILGDWKRGIISAPCGAGKTEIAIGIYQKLTIPTLFLVHRKDLVYQTQARFKNYGIDAGIIGDGIYNPKPELTISTIQSLYSLAKKDFNKLLKDILHVEQVFFDEAHLISAKLSTGNQFVKISHMLTNAWARWGLTATPFMRDDYSNLLLLGATGDVISSVSTAYLIEKGYLVPPKVIIQNLPKLEKCPTRWPDCYNIGVVLNSYRNEKIIEWMYNLPKPCIVMTTQLSHCRILQNLAERNGIKVPIVDGSTPTNIRKDKLNDLAKGSLPYLITTTLFDEGMDIPELKSLVLAGGGKSSIKMIQRIGRGLRPAPGKDSVTIIDFNDTSSRVLKQHSNKRLSVWEGQKTKIEYAE